MIVPKPHDAYFRAGLFPSLATAVSVAASAGRPLLIDGAWSVSAAINVPSSSHLILGRGAVVTATTPDISIFAIGAASGSATNIVIEGPGKLQGTWNPATSQGTATGNKQEHERLISINNGAGVVTAVSNIRIEGITIDKASKNAIWIETGTGRSITDITIRNVHCVQNLAGIYLVMGGDLGTIERLTIDGLVVDETWRPDSRDALKGGNGIAINGPVSALRVENCDIAEAGRITFELTTPSWSTAGRSPVNPIITNNRFGPGTYRTFSVFGSGMKITGNTINETDWIELSGRDIEFSGNTCTGPGVRSQQITGDSTKQAAFSQLWHIHHNHFEMATQHALTASFSGIFWADLSDDIEFAHNTIVWRDGAGAPSGFPDNSRLQVIRLERSRNVRVIHNRFIWEAAEMDRSLWTFRDCLDCSFSDNSITCLATSLKASIAASVSIQGFYRLQRCRIERNTVRATAYLALPYAPVFVDPADPTQITRRKFSATATFTDTTASSAVVLNTPPGSPVTNGYYLVGDTPTDAWVGNPRTFAKWDGAVWSYEAVTDLFNDLSTASAYFPTDGGAPTRATTGDTYAIVRRAALVRCVVRDNTFDAIPNMLKGTGFGRAIVFNGTTNNGQVAWQNSFSGNDLAADYATRGKTGIAT